MAYNGPQSLLRIEFDTNRIFYGIAYDRPAGFAPAIRRFPLSKLEGGQFGVERDRSDRTA